MKIIYRKKYSDKELITGIKEQDSKILEYIYNEYFNKIAHFVSNNSGSWDEAKDIFQEGIIQLYHKINEGKFELKAKDGSSIGATLYKICYNKWHNVLRKRKVSTKHIDSLNKDDFISNTEDQTVEDIQYELFKEYFQKMGEQCKELISLKGQGLKFTKIKEKLGTTLQENSLTKRFGRCILELQEMIFNDVRYKDLLTVNN